MRFSKNITNASQFQYGTYRAASDNAGTFCSRFQEYAACAEYTDVFMRNGSTNQRYSNQVFLSVFNAFTNSFRNLCSFTQAHAYMTIFITYNNKCSEGETTSAFNNLSNTVDENDFFL